jgi:hypothetical protein
MDNIASAAAAPKTPGFFKHIFDDNYKGELLNVLQYGLFVMIPLTILIRNLNYFFPELDEGKGNLEIFIEALGQLGITFVIILMAHRIITYFTPWGGIDYPKINMPTIIMLFLWIVISFGLGHIGKKVNYLLENWMPLPRPNFWNEASSVGGKSQKSPVVRVTQPLSHLPPPQATHIVSQPDYISRQNQVTPPIIPPTQGEMPSLPANTMSSQMYSGGQMTSHYNSMGGYNQALDNATMAQSREGSIQDTLHEGFAPQAANEALGGGFSSF